MLSVVVCGSLFLIVCVLLFLVLLYRLIVSWLVCVICCLSDVAVV